MSADKTKLIIPGKGTVFHAPKLTPPPADPLGATGFKLLADGPAPWKNLGHTSKSNTIAFTKEGGEKEVLDSFLQDSVRTTSSSVKWGINVAALQIDADTLDMAFDGEIDPATGGYIVAPGSSIEVALFVYFQDQTGSLGFWLPSVELSAGDAPSVDTANFFELPLTGSILGVDEAVMPSVNGRAGAFQIFHPGLTP